MLLCLLLLLHLLPCIFLPILYSVIQTKIARCWRGRSRGCERQLATCRLTCVRMTEASLSLCLFTLMAPEHICVTWKGGGGLARGTETHRKLHSEVLNRLTGVILPPRPPTPPLLLHAAYIKEPCFNPVPALWLCYPRKLQAWDSPEKWDGKAGGGERLPGDFSSSSNARSRSSRRQRKNHLPPAVAAAAGPLRPLAPLTPLFIRLPLLCSLSHPLFSRKCLSLLRGVSHFCLSLHPFPLITVQFSSALGISSSPFPVLGVSTFSRLCASLHPSILPLSTHWCVRASLSCRRLPALALQRCPEQPPPPPPGPARPP